MIALASKVGTFADMLQAHLEFHLAAGVDVVVLESAGDVALPERFMRDGAIKLVRGTVRAAAEASGADWVIEGDLNEFWWPRGGTLKEVLERVSLRYGSVQALSREFIPVTGPEPFVNRMIYRLARQPPERRLVRRATTDAVDAPPVRGWYPIEVLRFQVDETPPYDNEQVLRQRVADRVLRIDTRLGDALKALAAGRAPVFASADVAEEATFAADLAALGQADVAHTRVRLDELEARLAALETGLVENVKRKLRARRSRL